MYTSPSFPIGNKSYKLFSFRKTPRYRPSKTREDWHGRPFLRRYLILNTHAFEKKLHEPQGPSSVCSLYAGRRGLHQLDRHGSRKRRVYPHRSGGRRHRAAMRKSGRAEMSSQLVYLSSNQSGYDMALTAGQRASGHPQRHAPHRQDPERDCRSAAGTAPHHPQSPGDGSRGYGPKTAPS